MLLLVDLLLLEAVVLQVGLKVELLLPAALAAIEAAAVGIDVADRRARAEGAPGGEFSCNFGSCN